jgi:uncharacterized protein (DUF362 family)
MADPAIVSFSSYERSVPEALDAIGAAKVLARQTRVLIKPNLVGAYPPPVTTPVAFTEAVVRYVREHSDAVIIIAEGVGDSSRETPDVFKALGYADLASRLGLELVDLNTAELTDSKSPDAKILPEMRLPRIVFESYVISAPVLKAHLFCKLTGALKNMMGLLPPELYGGGGGWKKSSFHDRLDTKIRDLIFHRAPDLSVMDATMGLPRSHLSGPCCEPLVNKILAGFDPFALDREAAGLLGLDWESVGHLRR